MLLSLACGIWDFSCLLSKYWRDYLNQTNCVKCNHRESIEWLNTTLALYIAKTHFCSTWKLEYIVLILDPMHTKNEFKTVIREQNGLSNSHLLTTRDINRIDGQHRNKIWIITFNTSHSKREYRSLYFFWHCVTHSINIYALSMYFLCEFPLDQQPQMKTFL